MAAMISIRVPVGRCAGCGLELWHVVCWCPRCCLMYPLEKRLSTVKPSTTGGGECGSTSGPRDRLIVLGPL